MKEAGRLGCFTKIFFSFVADWTNTMQLTDTPGWVRGLKISTTRVHRTLVYLARLSLSLGYILHAHSLTWTCVGVNMFWDSNPRPSES